MALSLKKLDNFHGRKGPLLLIIMDGVGVGRNDDSNAVFLAETPTLDRLFTSKLYTRLQAHGVAVGLPSDDDMGNSEIGHNALGAGRVFDQGAKRVNKAIESGDMFDEETWQKAVARAKDSDGAMHFIGLHSDGNVHSHTKHLYAMLRRAAADGVARCRVHVLHDGRDVPPTSALDYIDATEKVLKEINEQSGVDYRIASGGGRMVTTMDRYGADWSVVERGWKAHVLGEAREFASAREAVETMYDEDPEMTDQYMDAFVVVDDGKPVGTIEDGDSVVFFNFRGDRAIEITMAFEYDDFDKFDRKRRPDVFYAGMMLYDGDLNLPSNYLVPPPKIERTISQYLCAEKVKCFAVSETQKFGHVTYFWNGNRSGYVCEEHETYREIPSDRIQFDKKPAMKAREIAEWTEQALRGGEYRFGRLNFANGDMVGHTGVMKAAIEAMEVVDECVGRLLKTIEELGGVALVTADHGNSDEMFTMKKGKKQIVSAHTLNPVPFVVVDPAYDGEYKMATVENPGLSNVASTICNFLGYEPPEDYRPSLIEFV